jgi:formate hydrogenlyase subunit 3/multisubunit Na+/H+ antiporter MnhD subunit
MALTSLLLVLAEHHARPAVREAAVWYAVMTHLGLVLLLAGLSVYAVQAGGETFAALLTGTAGMAPTVRGLVERHDRRG